MSRITIEYNPKLSVKTRRLIATNIIPCMVSNNETSAQYEISLVVEFLEGYIVKNFGNTINATILYVEEEEIKLIKQLVEEGVHYLEF